jgi:DNA topoisomerase IB
VTRLRRVSCDGPGLRRRRRGSSFGYTYLDGTPVTDLEVLQRIRDLAIPPAWKDVWICPHPRGHLQAVGTDARGRRQYLYHPAWRQRRDEEKHRRVVLVAARLPQARDVVAEQLAGREVGRERVLACAFRLLDLGFFRVGGDDYAEENGSFGLSTLRREHVKIHRGGGLTFAYTGKHGIARTITLHDPAAHAVVSRLARRQHAREHLFGWPSPRSPAGWHDMSAADVNDYVRELLGDATAKDFRTWHATVLAAVALAVSTSTLPSPTARKRAVARAMREVSTYLGNTPAVCRASYVDPRLVDLFHDGRTICGVLSQVAKAPGPSPEVEGAVLELLAG